MSAFNAKNKQTQPAPEGGIRSTSSINTLFVRQPSSLNRGRLRPAVALIRDAPLSCFPTPETAPAASSTAHCSPSQQQADQRHCAPKKIPNLIGLEEIEGFRPHRFEMLGDSVLHPGRESAQFPA
ncbi:MAG: hypothetical protein WBM63_01560 [Sedimenticolaceae bacterium]